MPGRGYWVLEGVGAFLEEGVGCWRGGHAWKRVLCAGGVGLLDWEDYGEQVDVGIWFRRAGIQKKGLEFYSVGGGGGYLMAGSLV